MIHFQINEFLTFKLFVFIGYFWNSLRFENSDFRTIDYKSFGMQKDLFGVGVSSRDSLKFDIQVVDSWRLLFED